MDRCSSDTQNKDFVRREISTALRLKKNIVPVNSEDFKFPDADTLPEDIRDLCKINSICWYHAYQKACMEKIEQFMLKADKR